MREGGGGSESDGAAENVSCLPSFDAPFDVTGTDVPQHTCKKAPGATNKYVLGHPSCIFQRNREMVFRRDRGKAFWRDLGI